MLPVYKWMRSNCADWDWVDIMRTARLDNEAANPEASCCCFNDCIALFFRPQFSSPKTDGLLHSPVTEPQFLYFWFSFLIFCLTALCWWHSLPLSFSQPPNKLSEEYSELLKTSTFGSYHFTTQKSLSCSWLLPLGPIITHSVSDMRLVTRRSCLCPLSC